MPDASVGHEEGTARSESAGVLAPRAAWRAHVVRHAAAAGICETGAAQAPRDPAKASDEACSQRAGGRLWADLMRRSFGFDVLACPRCGERLRLTALIEQAAVIARILGHLGLPGEIPGPCAARAPPLPMDRGAHPSDDISTAFDSCS